MVINIVKDDLSKLYRKAEENYKECVKDEDNSFLKEEILIPINQIQVKNSDIKVVFSREITEKYSFEICLTLWDPFVNKLIGKYVYIEDDQGKAVDDNLVLF